MPDRGQVLVVCRANVCRSPTLALLLGRYPGLDIEVRTAGWRADPRLSWCDQIRALVPPGPDADDLAATHRPIPLSPHQVAEADLVLAADRRTRAEIARMAPALTARTFTAIEAAHLLAAVAAQASTAGVPLTEIATRLDDVRGLVELPAARESRWPWRVRPGVDLLDPHSTAHRVTHRQLLPRLEQVAASLAAGLDHSAGR
ncbi:arsenate reductase/protein-tyrosine-phosphatase family protein [Nocardioides sp. GXZ039]|uniref:arsenate reductase/protein-tyrosine-phosphatase family protein n=1 Tax=Nocardioides sp. GXZ039 TaxID=3136018 RepID=UPI0030F4556E